MRKPRLWVADAVLYTVEYQAIFPDPRNLA